MAAQATLTHLFAELSNLEDLGVPLKGSSRIRYTCMSVSRRYIALGCNTGGVYVFGRDSLKHLQSVYGDVDSSPVSVVALSPNELNVGFAVSSGQVVVMEMNVERRCKPERLRQTVDHLGAMVTAMVWDSASCSLFVGDSAGKVTHINIPTSKAKTIFKQPSQTIVKLDCGVCQLDWWGNKLLASSLTRTYLLNTTKQQFSQIGKKPREGEFGACFFLEPSSNYPVIYCGRPGSRMWEVDFEGNVLNTHQFKQLLATQPLPIVSTGVDFTEALQATEPGPQSVNFLQMFSIGEFILTWSNRGLYVFDPINVKVVLWTDTLNGIKDICIFRNEVYIFFDTQKVRRLIFLPILNLCAALVTRQRCMLAADLLLFVEHFYVKPTLLKHVKKELLPQLVVFLREAGQEEVMEKVQAMLEDVSESSMDSVIAQEDSADSALYPLFITQSSGIVVVNDGALAIGDLDRRKSPSSRFSPVSLGEQQSGRSSRSSSLSGAVSNGHHSVDKPENSLESAEGSESRQSPDPEVGEFSAAMYKPVDENVAEMMCTSEEYSEFDVGEDLGLGRETNFAPNYVEGPVIHSEQSGEINVMLTHIHSEQASGTDNRLVVAPPSSVHDNNLTEQVDITSSSLQDIQKSIVPVSKRNSQSEEDLLDRDRAESETSEYQSRTHSPVNVPPTQSGAMRKVSSMPDIVVQGREELRRKMSTESSFSRESSVQATLSRARRANSVTAESGSEAIAKNVTKKKKRRRVNEVDIPMAGSTSGHMKRSQSTETLRQKKQREALQRIRSLNSSPVNVQDDLYQKTDTDPDSVSIATISSIEEEESAIGDAVFTTPGPMVGDVFSTTTGPTIAALSHKGLDALNHMGMTDFGEDVRKDILAVSEDASGVGSDSETVPLQHPGEMNGRIEVPRPQALRSSQDIACSMELADIVETGHVHGGNSDTTIITSTSPENEIIPPLIERLSALGVSAASVSGVEGGGNIHDLSLMKNLITEASKQKIASVKERVTRFSSSTRSLIRRVKEKNLLVSRSPSRSPPYYLMPTVLSMPSSKDDIDVDYCDEVPSSVDPDLYMSCPVSLEPLLIHTEIIEKQLRDHSVLLSREDLKTVLNNWAAELNRTLKAYQWEMCRRQAEKDKMEAAAQLRDNSLFSKEKVENQNSANFSGDVAMNSEAGRNGNLSCPAESVMNSSIVDPRVEDTAAEDRNCVLVLSQNIDEGVSDAVKSLEQLETNGKTDHDCSASNSDGGEESVTGNSSVVAVVTGPNIFSCTKALTSDGDSLTSQSGANPMEQNANKSDSQTQNSPVDVSDRVSVTVSKNHQVVDEVSKQKDIVPELKSLPADETVKDSEISKHIDWSRICHVKDPFHLSPQQHTVLSTLVSYCLECGCFGNASTMFAVPSGGSTEPKTISAKEQTSDTVPSSFKSFSDAECSFPSHGDKGLHCVNSEEWNSHSQHSSANGNKSLLSNSCTVCAKLNAEPKATHQAFNKDSVTSVCQCAHHQEGRTCNTHDTDFKGPKHVSNTAEVRDEERALFVRLYFYLVPLWKLRHLLMEGDGKEVYATWCALITCCQALGHGDIVWTKIQDKDVTGALDYLRSGILPSKHAFLGHVASLFELNATRVTDFISEIPQRVKLGDILRLCRLCSKSPQEVVSRYLTQRLGATPSVGRMEIVKQLCSFRETRLAVLGCLLHLHSSFLLSHSSASHVSSSMRLKASVNTSRLSPDIVDELLECVLSLLREGEMVEALDACWKHRYWPGCFRLLKQTDQWQRALQLVVEINDINLLNGRKGYGFTPHDVEQWKHLLHLFQRVSSSQPPVQEPSSHTDLPLPPAPTPTTTTSVPPPVSEATSMVSTPPAVDRSAVGGGIHWEEAFNADGTFHSGNMKSDRETAELDSPGSERASDVGADNKECLSWMSLGMLAAQRLGASTAIQLLQACGQGDQGDQGTGEVFTADFYRTCLGLSALEHQQKLVIHNMLEKVDSYLWAKKPVHLTPQVHYAVTQEKVAVQTSNTDDHHYQSLFARLSGAPLVEKQLAEDPDCHWGVKANILRLCEVCQIQVTETVSHFEPGVFSFKCGHVFHKFCVPQKECPLC